MITSKLGFSQSEVKRIIEQTVLVANSDISNFYSTKPEIFLANTWKVLPEANPLLLNLCHTVSDYRRSIQGMYKFFANIDINNIVHTLPERANEKDFQLKLKRTRVNLDVGLNLFQVELVTMAILESLAFLTGGDIAFILCFTENYQKSVRVNIKKNFKGNTPHNSKKIRN